MNIHSDFTSSAATRTYDATVTFANKKLIQGNAIYSSGDTLGKERIVHCMITNQEWAATEIKDSCEFPFTTPATTKEGLELQIKNSELKPVNKTCGHDDLCYTLVQ
ncbi:MAG TPA: hypothetical protein VLB02_00475 [Candidatus Paceibacterota bacterium]|nr:hypothetical protein [Candidatus Paceibacterota bacterium]